MEFTQTGRSLVVQTPLGTDVFLLVAFRGREELSHLFEFELDLLSIQSWIDPKEIVGKAVNFQVSREGAEPRWFSGFVSSFGSAGLNEDGFHQYTLRLVPWLWFLGKRSDCRIFQNKTVPEIVEEVFSGAGFSDFDFGSVQRTYPPKEYCVQLRETDLQFVSRLLEEAGIFYFFRFEEGKHVLVLADGVVAYQDCGTVEYTTSSPSSEQVSRWEHRFEFISGAWSHADFNFTTPTTELSVSSPTVVDLPGLSAYERYEYPGRFEDKDEGEAKAQARMMAEEAGYDVVVGAGGCPAFHLAGRFTVLASTATGEDDAAYVLTRLEHSGTEPSLFQAGGSAGGSVYENTFVCIPADVPYAPPRRTPKPLVSGLQTAIVVGPAGEEIYTDEYGRVKVKFHWDRGGKYDDTASCWIRVMQAVAGKKWGFQALPRIGQEVILEFLDGDPDRPIVVGAVYNANTMPTYELPANKTQSGWKSRSTPKAGTGDFNELRFEDKKGEEHIFIHAQKDEHHRVVNNRLDHVGNDEHRTVVGNQYEKVDKDHHSIVLTDEFLRVEGDQSETVLGDRKVEIGGNDNLTIKGDQSLKITGDQGFKVTGSQSLAASQAIHGKAGTDINHKAGKNYAAEGGMNVHIKGGMNVVIEAGMSITLKAGAAKVVIGPANVDIVGVMVNINSGGGGGSGSGCSPQSPAAADSPDEPEEAQIPMAKVAAADSDKYSKEAVKAKSAEAKWLAIETAPSTPQAAALESAAETGHAFCET